MQVAFERRILATGGLDQLIALLNGSRAPGRLVVLQNFGYGVVRVVQSHSAITALQGYLAVLVGDTRRLVQLVPPLAQLRHRFPSRQMHAPLAAGALLVLGHSGLDQRLARL